MGKAVLALAAVTLAGVLAVLVAAAGDDRGRSFTVGLPAVRDAAVLTAGEEVCRRGIPVAAAFDRVVVPVNTAGAPGPPLRLTIGAHRHRVEGGYAGATTVEAPVPLVPAGGKVTLCVKSVGRHPVIVNGSPFDTPADRLHEPEHVEIGASFERSEARSMLSLVPTAFERAARFNPGAPWTFWMLLGAVAVGLPAALAAAVRAAYRSEPPTGAGD